jgi:hypothetical protein
MPPTIVSASGPVHPEQRVTGGGDQGGDRADRAAAAQDIRKVENAGERQGLAGENADLDRDQRGVNQFVERAGERELAGEPDAVPMGEEIRAVRPAPAEPPADRLVHRHQLHAIAHENQQGRGAD